MTPETNANKPYTRDGGKKGKERPALAGQAQDWPSPDANLFQDGQDCTPEEWEGRRQRLKENCPTPNGNGCGTPLAMAASLWAPPRSSENENRTTRNASTHGNQHGLTLAGQSADWSACPSSLPDPLTPAGDQSSTDSLSLLLHYRRWLYVRLGVVWKEEETDAETLKANPVRLNPAFACWLMGWEPFSTGLTPFEWTNSEESATESSSCKPRWLLQSFCTALGLGG